MAPIWHVSSSSERALRPSGELSQDCLRIRSKNIDLERDWNSQIASVWRGQPLRLANTSTTGGSYEIRDGFPLPITYAQWCSLSAGQRQADRRGYSELQWGRIIEVLNNRCREIYRDLDETRRIMAGCGLGSEPNAEACALLQREWSSQISATWRGTGIIPPRARGATGAINDGDNAARGFPLRITYQQWCSMAESQRRSAVRTAVESIFAGYRDLFTPNQEDWEAWSAVLLQQINSRCNQIRSDLADGHCATGMATSSVATSAMPELIPRKFPLQVSSKVIKGSGAVSFGGSGSAAMWLGGAVIGATATYFIVRKRS